MNQPERPTVEQRSPFNTMPANSSDSMSIPDFYSDGITVQGGYAGFTLIFNTSPIAGTEPVPVAVIRVSPQQALVMTRILEKVLLGYERDIGKINLPTPLFESLGIEESE